MRNYRKRQIVKVYKLRAMKNKRDFRFSEGAYIGQKNRAYCSILNHIKSEEEVLKTLKRR